MYWVESSARAGEAPQLLTAEIDPEAVETARRLIPVLANARDL